jgi:carbon storage regulator CsrA
LDFITLGMEAPMLVLSRKSLEKVLFPSLGVTVQVLQIKPNQVRLGIEAPPSVTVLRQELDKGDIPVAKPSSAHAVANLLNKLNLSVHVLEKQLSLGKSAEAQATLDQLKDALMNTDPESLAKISKPEERKCRSLVVEDDGNERELLAGLLEMNGCECRTAADGQEALQYLEENQLPDFVLMDLWMPRCTGENAIRQIRGNPRYRDLKVFAVSGSTPKDATVSIGPEGFDAWFTKPLNPTKLWEAIRSELS